MPRRYRKLLSRKAATRPIRRTECIISIPPPPPDYKIPPDDIDKTGDSDTIDGRLARVEAVAHRAKALHHAASISAEYARDLSRIIREMVAYTKARVQALLPPYPEAPPPLYENSVTPTHKTFIGTGTGTANLYTIDELIARAHEANGIAKDLYAAALKEDRYTENLARWAKRRIVNTTGQFHLLLD